MSETTEHLRAEIQALRDELHQLTTELRTQSVVVVDEHGREAVRICSVDGATALTLIDPDTLAGVGLLATANLASIDLGPEGIMRGSITYDADATDGRETKMRGIAVMIPRTAHAS
jgi:hypothetical protein